MEKGETVQILGSDLDGTDAILVGDVGIVKDVFAEQAAGDGHQGVSSKVLVVEVGEQTAKFTENSVGPYTGLTQG